MEGASKPAERPSLRAGGEADEKAPPSGQGGPQPSFKERAAAATLAIGLSALARLLRASERLNPHLRSGHGEIGPRVMKCATAMIAASRGRELPLAWRSPEEGPLHAPAALERLRACAVRATLAGRANEANEANEGERGPAAVLLEAVQGCARMPGRRPSDGESASTLEMTALEPDPARAMPMARLVWPPRDAWDSALLSVRSDTLEGLPGTELLMAAETARDLPSRMLWTEPPEPAALRAAATRLLLRPERPRRPWEGDACSP